jgi:hypothetical protein
MRRVATALILAWVVALAGPASADDQDDLCRHLPHLAACEGRDVGQVARHKQPMYFHVEAGVRLAVIDDPATFSDTERLYVASTRYGVGTRGSGGFIGMDMHLGTGSEGGMWYRWTLVGGPRLHTNHVDIEPFAGFGLDGLLGEIGIGPQAGVGVQGFIRFPRVTLIGRAEVWARPNKWDTDQPRAPVGERMNECCKNTRYGVGLMLGHRLPEDMSEAMYSAPLFMVEIEQMVDTEIVWFMFGNGLFAGNLPR